MQDMRGKVKRRIASLVLEHGAPPPVGAPVTAAGGQHAGELTTSVQSDLLGRPAALARLAVAFTQSGTELSVGGVRAWILDQPA
jgi:glycine cleavage system aminomethyltransferase T